MLPTAVSQTASVLSGALRGLAIHEYQSKQLLRDAGVDTLAGAVAYTPEEARIASIELAQQGYPSVAVKAQIHAGGRGKGHFIDGSKMHGGVKISHSSTDAFEFSRAMLGNTLVTKQTGPEGRVVNAVYLEAAADIKRELYLSFVLSRADGGPVIIASTEGGVDIETVAEESPEKLITIPVDIVEGLSFDTAQALARDLGFAKTKEAAEQICSLYQLFMESDATQIEINPLAELTNGNALCVDAKFNFDDNAEFRQPEIFKLRDTNEEDERETEAKKFDLNYVALEGNIGCLVNGAGLSMGTMDLLHHYGGAPANFLDVGGGANETTVTEAFKIILSDDNVSCCCVNIFGGIVKCDMIARAVIAAAKKIGVKVPVVVRLEGTNVEEGRRILKESGMDIIAAVDLADAAKKAVAAAKEYESRK